MSIAEAISLALAAGSVIAACAWSISDVRTSISNLRDEVREYLETARANDDRLRSVETDLAILKSRKKDDR